MRYRDYQRHAIDSVFKYFGEGNTGNPIIAAPTGTGKSVMLGGFIYEVFQAYPGQRIMMVTHVKELIEQNFKKLLALWPSAPAGIYSSGLKRRDTQFPITYAGIASVAKKAHLFGSIDLVLIDECHLLSVKGHTMYQRFINDLKKVNPHLKVIGLTATPYRMGQGLLTDGGLFTDFCIDMTTMEGFNWFLSEGYLCPLVPRPTGVILDVDGVAVQSGEFNQRQLQEAVDREEITHAALTEVLNTVGDTRKHWLVFASGIEHTEHVANMLDGLGVSTTFVHSKISNEERDKRLEGFEAGQYTAMVNNGVLTTGYDFPAIDLIVLLRPTRSPGLYVQMLGRGTRPVYADGFDLDTTEGRLMAIANSQKRNCLVLDFAGNVPRLGPINDPVLPKRKGKGGGQAPVRICDNCGIYCHASLTQCPECGHEFPRQTHITSFASTDRLIADHTPQVEDFDVDRVIYARHTRDGRPDSIKVTYFCGLRMFNEWICLEHGGYPARKAREWWGKRCEGGDPPGTTDEALSQLDSLAIPKRIGVWINKKYPEVMTYEF